MFVRLQEIRFTGTSGTCFGAEELRFYFGKILFQSTNKLIYFIIIHLIVFLMILANVNWFFVHEAIQYQTMSPYYGSRHNVVEAHVFGSFEIISLYRGN
jgi:hypothetical protein